MTWWDEALCAQVGGDFWQPGKGGNPKIAKQICAECRVREACLEYALADDVAGIYGGTSRHERRQMQRRRRDVA